MDYGANQLAADTAATADCKVEHSEHASVDIAQQRVVTYPVTPEMAQCRAGLRLSELAGSSSIAGRSCRYNLIRPALEGSRPLICRAAMPVTSIFKVKHGIQFVKGQGSAQPTGDVRFPANRDCQLTPGQMMVA